MKTKLYREPNWFKRQWGNLIETVEFSRLGLWCAKSLRQCNKETIVFIMTIIGFSAGGMHWYFYQLPWVYETESGDCIAIATHNQFQDCLGDRPKRYETVVVPNGTTFEELARD